MKRRAACRRRSTSRRAVLAVIVAALWVLLAVPPCLAGAGGTGGGSGNPPTPGAASAPRYFQGDGVAAEAEAVPKDDPGSLQALKLAGLAGSSGSRASPVWYLAEGSTNWGFDTAITIMNPNAKDVTIRMTYMTLTGPITKPDIHLEARSVLWVFPRDEIGNRDFSTTVKCLEDLPIAVDRTMYWDDGGPDGGEKGAHYSVGVTSRSHDWYLPEGSTGGDFETFIVVQNPNKVPVEVVVEFMDLLGPVGQEVLDMAPGSRQTVNVADTVPDTWNVSTRVSCETQPIIAERAMYWASRTEGHDSIGTPAPAKRWMLPEGCTAEDFDTWVMILNPNNYKVIAQYDYMTDGELHEGGSVELNPFSRTTLHLNEQMPGEWGISTRVTCKDPVIAERAMYGNGRKWGHDSIGMDGVHDIIYLPGGRTRDDWETWVLVQNPNDRAAKIDLYYLTEAGSQVNFHFGDTVPAFSRKTYDMGRAIGEDSAAGAVIISRTPGVKIAAEQAIYLKDESGARISAGDTIGGYLDQQ